MPQLPTEIQGIEVRGYTSHNTPALTILRVLSYLIDFCFILFTMLLITDYFKISPTPQLSFIFIMTALLYWLPQKKLFGVTLGERSWLLKPKNKERLKIPSRLHSHLANGIFFSLKERLYQRDSIHPLPTFMAVLLTALCLFVTVNRFRSTVLSHPDWLKTEQWHLKSFTPETQDWSVSPFFYLLGGWPKSFQGKPIFYTLPYEVGPPTRFVGHVIAYWDHPNISVTFEGPKTPDLAANRTEFKNCFEGAIYSLHCLSLRETVLGRHIQEIRAKKNLVHWSMKWFQVENPLLTSEESPQGIYLSAVGKTWTQDRFILINANGTHQAIILRRPNNERGQEAFALLQKSIGSIRNFNELNSGKAWIDRRLEITTLKDLKNDSDPTLLSNRLGEIQQLILSKITVDPADFNSYFHLAGTSVMLAKATPDRRFRIKIALDNLKSAQHFASDVAPNDPRNVQIQNLETEIRKILGS
jgi:hypothetical protein